MMDQAGRKMEVQLTYKIPVVEVYRKMVDSTDKLIPAPTVLI